MKKITYKNGVVDIEKYLDQFSKITEDPTLEAMEYFMNKFGNPDKVLKIIHVAGTNGKGSVCEMLSTVLTASGYKVGKFISPHLLKFNDGILINNNPIKDSEVEGILLQLSKEIDKYDETHKTPVKWFEVITSMALIYFARNNCDLVVLETGLGGTTDCTNIANSMISIITNIGKDHVDILGDSIFDIAKHKAGIIKKNSNTIWVEQKEILNVFENRCKEQNSKLHLIKQEDVKNYLFGTKIQKFDYKNYKEVEINLRGRTQIYNAAEVLECIDILKQKGYIIPEEDIRNGLKNVVHKARLEEISREPLIVFDGGHNENAINNLRENIDRYYGDKERIYIISLLKTKDYKNIIKNLCKDKDSVFIFTTGNSKERYVAKEDLYMEAKKYLPEDNLIKEELKDAVNMAKQKFSDKVIFIIGSFYVYKDVV